MSSDQVIGRGVIAMDVDGTRAEATMAQVVQMADRMERTVVQKAGGASAALAGMGRGAAEGASAALAKVVQSAEASARAIGRHATSASEALAGMGKGAAAGAADLDAAGRRMVAALERERAALTLSRTEFLAWQAERKGVSRQVYEPLIRDIEAATKAQEALRQQGTQTAATMTRVGVSVGQTRAAMAQLPAQFTDIFTSLAGGQNPLLVAIQQGGQIKDSFGGLGPMFTALRGAITPAMAAIGSGAAVVGGLGVAFAKGRAEGEEFARGLVLSGNAAGTTTGQLTAMARAVDEVAGTQAQASAVLAGLVAKGGTGAAQLQLITEAAIRLERVGGGALEKTIGQFNALANDPANAAKKLNEETNFLTIEIYRQIKALQDQGRESEAAALAQTKYAEALIGRTKDIEQQLGSLQRGLRSAKDLWSEFWDAALNVGRPQTVEDQLAAAEAALAAAPAPRRGANPLQADSRREAMRQRVEDLRAQVYAEREAAAINGARADSTKKQMEADKDAAEAVKRHAEELRRLREAGARLLVDADEALQVARAEVEGRRALTTAEKDALDVMIALRDGKVALTDAEKRGLALKLEERIALEGVIKAREQYAKAQEASAGVAAAAGNRADDVGRQLLQQREYNASIGKTTAQLRDLEQAKLSDAEATAEQLAWEARRDGNEAQATNIDREIAKLRLLREEKLKTYGLIDAADMKAKAEQSAADAAKAFESLFDPSRAQSFGEALQDAFGGAGSALKSLTNTLDAYARRQAEVQRAAAVHMKGLQDPLDLMAAQQRLTTLEQEQQVKLYGALAGAARGFFKEGSDGYKAMSALEAAFTIAQLAQSMVRGQAAAVEAVVNQGKGDPYTAWARMAGMAAAVAQLGFAVGFFGGGGGGGSGLATAEQRQGGAGTGRVITSSQLDAGNPSFVIGTVLGAPSAATDSMANGISALEETAEIHLDYARGMLDSLRAIETSLGGLGSLLVRSAGGGITTGKNLGIQTGLLGKNEGDPILKMLGVNDSSVIQALAGSGSLLGRLGVLGQSLWGKTKADITDSGLSLFGSIDQLMRGVGVEQYADVTTTTSSWFGLRKKSNTDTVFGDVEKDIAAQFGLVFQQIGDTVKMSAALLGRDGGQALADAIGAFLVDVPRLSLKGLEGDELQDALSNAIGAVADSLTSTIVPGLDTFQRVGEGYYETLVRVASGVEQAEYRLDLLGVQAVDYTAILRRQGDVGAEIVRQSITGAESVSGALTSVGAIVGQLDGSAADLADAYKQLTGVRTQMVGVGLSAESLTTQLMRGAGGLDSLESALGAYSSAFFSEQERLAAKSAALTIEFAKLGVAMPSSRQGMRDLVAQVIAGGEQGERTAGKLLALSEALGDLFDATDEAAERRTNERLGLEQRLLQAQGNTAELRRREREELDASNRALYDSVVAQERLQEVLGERGQLERTLLQLQGNTAELRRRERLELDETNRALYDTIKALEDQQAAAQRAQQRLATWNSGASVVAEGVRSAFGAVASAIEDERRKIESAAEERVRKLEAEADKIKSTWSGLVDSLQSSLQSLQGLAAVDGGREMALRTLRQAAADIRAGREVDFDRVKSAASTVSRMSPDAYVTRLDFQRDVAGTSALLRDVSGGARDAMTAGLARIAAAQVAAEKQLADQLDVLDEQLKQAQSSAAALVSIDTGVKTVASTLATLAAAIAAAAAVQGKPDLSGPAPTPTGRWLESGGAQVWASGGGAVAIDTGDASGAIIRGKTGNRYTIHEAIAYANDRLKAGDITGLHATLVREGIDSTSFDALMGYKPGTSLAEALARGLPAFETGTNYVPRTGMAVVHEGERIFTRADNAAITRALTGNPGGGPATAALLAEVRELRQSVAAQALALEAIALSTRRTADSTEQLEIASFAEGGA